MSLLKNKAGVTIEQLYKFYYLIRLVLREFSLVSSVTVKSNNWNLAWPELLYTNFSVEKLELYQSLFVEQFIHHSWKILCVINDRSHTFNLWFNTWFYNSEILHTSPSSNHQGTKSFKNFMILVITWTYNRNYITIVRGGSTNAVTSKMELFVIIVNGWKLWLHKFSLFIYIFKLFIWRLFYLIARFVFHFTSNSQFTTEKNIRAYPKPLSLFSVSFKVCSNTGIAAQFIDCGGTFLSCQKSRIFFFIISIDGELTMAVPVIPPSSAV